VSRFARPLAWTLWSVAIVLAAIGAALVLTSLDANLPDNWGFRGYSDVIAPFVATPGLLIARRQPRNAIGWILLVAGVSTGYGGFAQEYAARAVVIAPGSLPGAFAIAWVASWSWTFFAGSMLTVVPQLFPTGRPISPRWRPLLLAGPAFLILSFFIFSLRPGPTENATFIENPLALSGALADLRTALEAPLGALMFVAVALSGAALAVRFRRARGVERQQLKWVASAAVLCAIAFAAMVFSNSAKPTQVAMVAAFMTMPVAIGIAILRYRLYDIDVLINRALVYGATTVAIATAFFGGIILLQQLLRPIIGGSEVAVAVSTLASLGLFQPLLRRVQATVDRRFYRSRYDAARTLDAFSVRLRDEVDLDAVRAGLVDAVRDTVQPTHAGVWLRERS